MWSRLLNKQTGDKRKMLNLMKEIKFVVIISMKREINLLIQKSFF